MDDYMATSRGLINAAKSQIFAWNTPTGILRRITNILDFALSENWQSFKYLGIPICLKSLPASSWNPILDEIKSKFQQWGSHWLNPTGRVILIKSMLSALPIFQFSSLLAPVKIKQPLLKHLENFFDKGVAPTLSISFSKLEYCQSSKVLWGLGNHGSLRR